MLIALDNEVVFKRAFTNKLVFEQFIKDMFDVEISVSKIETEKKFYNEQTKIDITMDIYAETDDNRFVIEIQKIQYDHNFDRFLHYFIAILLEQQNSFKNYKIEKTVLGIIVLTRPYRFHELTGEPILDNYMVIDFNPRNIKGELIKLNNHQLKFINTSKKYNNNELPQNIQDWIDLFQKTIYKRNQSIKLNFNNKAIKKIIEIIDDQNIDAKTLTEIKQVAGKKEVLLLEYKAGIEEEKERSKKIIKKAEQEKQKAEQEKQKAEQEKQKAEQEKQKAEQNTYKMALNYAKFLFSAGKSYREIETETGIKKSELI